MPDDKITQELLALFENTKMENRQSYLLRGRKLEGSDTRSLISGWLAQMNAWADEDGPFDATLMDDMEAELGIRGIVAPADQAGSAVEKLAARSRAVSDQWNAEQIEGAEKQLQDRLTKVRPSKADKN